MHDMIMILSAIATTITFCGHKVMYVTCMSYSDPKKTVEATKA